MTSSPLSKLVRTSSDGACIFSLSIDDTDCLSMAGDVSTFLDEAIEEWLLLKPVHDAVKRLSHRRRSYAILLAIFLKPMLVPEEREKRNEIESFVNRLKFLTGNALESNAVERKSRKLANFNFPLH